MRAHDAARKNQTFSESEINLQLAGAGLPDDDSGKPAYPFYCPAIFIVNDSFPGFASIPSNETVPVFEMLPTALTITLIVTVKVAPFARFGTVQDTVPPREFTGGAVQAPAVVVTDVNCRLLGRTSRNTTFGASAPLLLITQVYASAVLTFALPRCALPVIARSVVTPVFEGGGGGSLVVTLALLLTKAVPALSVPLTVAELVMVWFCI
jgi:hypothetical protein